MKYKEKDRVRIKSLDWYNENKDEYGDIRTIHGEPFLKGMLDFCGLTTTIKRIIDDSYEIDIDNGEWYWTDEMIEGLVEEEEEVGLIDVFSSRWINEFNLPEGYIFKDENGNIINATKIVLEKKKKEYPKTYKECCKVVGIDVRDLDILDNMLDTTEIIYRKNLDRLLNSFRKLLICRDAYWKIAGDWKPDWRNNQLKYVIVCGGDNIINDTYTTKNCILAFPTPEMRDTFYENFKNEIEFCKELL